MALSILPGLSGYLDDELLRDAAATIQLTLAEYEQATEAYVKVSAYLTAPGSPFVSFDADIYAQGSMGFGTVIRPWRHIEFDLDAVMRLVLTDGSVSPAELLDSTFNYLRGDPAFAPRAERLPRCVRLNYPNRFHLDLVPARHDGTRPPTGIVIGDSDALGWKRANPKALLKWFEMVKVPVLRFDKTAAVGGTIEPPPGRTSHRTNTPLQLALQLLKRHRDQFFSSRSDLCTPSVLLTVIAGQAYDGDASVFQTLAKSALALAEVAGARDAPEIRNPGDHSEVVSEKWLTSLECWTAFRQWATAAARLLTTSQLRPTETLEALVGKTDAGKAIKHQASGVAAASRAGNLKVSSAGRLLTTSAANGLTSVRAHHFYGDD